MTNSYTTPAKQAKTVRLVGTLTINIAGKELKVSDSFKIQTDLAYSGLSLAEQETVYKACQLALEGKDISFSTSLNAQEVVSNKAKSKEPTELELALEALNKPDPTDIVEAVVRDDEATSKATKTALDILGASSVRATQGVK